MNGFCIVYIGFTNEIQVGWYNNNIIHGNYMTLDAEDMSIRQSGWYENGIRKGEMKRDPKLKMFSKHDVFDYEDPAQNKVNKIVDIINKRMPIRFQLNHYYYDFIDKDIVKRIVN